MLSNLGNFDHFMEEQMRIWNAPGIGISIVKDQEIVFSKGYGYRDYANKLPFTSATMFPIASNTKLFTAIAAGILVDQKKLTFDQPIRDIVPNLRFYDKLLDNSVTLRDMLGHRTGVSRCDMIWWYAPFSTKELFERIRFLKPEAPFRSRLIYNNLMYDAVGHIVELLSGKTWDRFIHDEILAPLDLTDTVFTIADMLAQQNHAVPFSERRDSDMLWQHPYTDLNKSSAAGTMVSNLNDMSRWVSVLMNGGMVAGKRVIPETILEATLASGLPWPYSVNDMLEFQPETNIIYGMGRQTSSYRGHCLVSHGGIRPAFHSQVSYLLREKIGAVVFVIGDHCAPLSNALSYNIYDRLLGLGETEWIERVRESHQKIKKGFSEARRRSKRSAVPNTQPSHDLEDYIGCYEHPAYGQLDIVLNSSQLQIHFRRVKLPLHHYHYDQFATDDDEAEGMWSLSFLTAPLGNIDRVSLWLDQAEVIFNRVPIAPALSVLEQLIGTYQTEFGLKAIIDLRRDNQLTLRVEGDPEVLGPLKRLQFLGATSTDGEVLAPLKGLQFYTPKMPTTTLEFVIENGRALALRQWNTIAEFVLARVEEPVSLDVREDSKKG